MKKRTLVIIYSVLVIVVFAAIFVIWAFDTGRFFTHADVPPTVTDAKELKSLPSPDESTFSKIFGTVAGWFSR